MLNTIQTTETIKVDSYPYGRLRCTAFFSIEFNSKKGFRNVFQTIDPKNGRHNAPKKSTYYDLGIQYRDEETGHIKTCFLSMNGIKELNSTCKFIAEHYDKFTAEQIEYFYIKAMSKVSMVACVQYCGSTFENLKPLFHPFVTAMTKGLKEKTNTFADAELDEVAIDAQKDPNYNPWKVTTH